MNDVSIIGPLGIRRFTLAAVCDESVGHEHEYDHVTIVIHGRVRVKYSYVDDGRVVEGESREFHQAEAIHIKANVRHTIKALEAGTTYVCVFSHRDFSGLVTQTYVGHELAYQ